MNKKVLRGALLAAAISVQGAPVQAKTPNVTQNVCNSDIIVNNAKDRIFALVQGFEKGKNLLTLCNKWNIVMTSPISTGKPGMRLNPKTQKKERRGGFTTEGVFRFTERIKQGKVSNLYNGSDGKPAKLPYWQRFNGAIGFHYGDTSSPSAGCVRVRYAQEFYNAVSGIGPSKVEVIVDETDPRVQGKKR